MPAIKPPGGYQTPWVGFPNGQVPIGPYAPKAPPSDAPVTPDEGAPVVAPVVPVGTQMLMGVGIPGAALAPYPFTWTHTGWRRPWELPLIPFGVPGFPAIGINIIPAGNVSGQFGMPALVWLAGAVIGGAATYMIVKRK